MRRKKIAQGTGLFRQLDTKWGVVSRVSVQQVQPGRKRCLMPWVRGWKTKTQKPKTLEKSWKTKTQKAKTPYQKLKNEDPET